ncbi:MAG: diacylglycerol kinase family protein [Candidatus Limnocylindrales bacterium]
MSGPIPVIWNPSAGGKLRGPVGGTSADSLRALFNEAGAEAQIIATQSAEDATAQVRRLVASGERLIVAAGGDGTIGLVAHELLGLDVTLGAIPLGSVMNIPRMLGVPRDTAEAVRLLADPAARSVVIDLGEANGRLFYEAASVGLHAAMFNAAHHFDDGRWGSPLRVLWMAFRYRPGRMQIVLDGSNEVRTRGLMAVVANGPYAGPGMTLAPEARLNDGLFDVRVFEHFSKPELLRHLVSIMFGRRAYVPRVSTYRAAEVRITGRRPLPCRADSIDLGMTPLVCRVRARTLKVLVGPAFSDGRVEATPQAG